MQVCVDVVCHSINQNEGASVFLSLCKPVRWDLCPPVLLEASKREPLSPVLMQTSKREPMSTCPSINQYKGTFVPLSFYKPVRGNLCPPVLHCNNVGGTLSSTVREPPSYSYLQIRTSSPHIHVFRKISPILSLFR